MKNILRFIVNLIFPSYCYLCGDVLEFNDYSVCSYCIENIDEFSNYCLKCGDIKDTMQEFCDKCANKQVYYSRLFSFAAYGKTIAKFLKIIKFKPSNVVFERLEFFYNLFYSHNETMLELENLVENIDVLLPVPIHENRLQSRGYNQAELIANVLGNVFEISVCSEVLTKIRDTQFLYGLSSKERENEIKDVFKVLNKQEILGKNVLLIDDISTTGTTFNAISKLLIDNGANMVFCFCVAKA